MVLNTANNIVDPIFFYFTKTKQHESTLLTMISCGHTMKKPLQDE